MDKSEVKKKEIKINHPVKRKRGRPKGIRKMYRKGERRFNLVKRKPLKKRKPTLLYSERDETYLKYLRVVRIYIQKKYELSLSELELILFLYDEKLFNMEEFNGYARILGFTSMKWMDKLKERGIIKLWRDEYGYKTIYTLTHKYKMVCYKFYKHLNGEPISVNPTQNPIFKSQASFSDKMYQKLIKKMNESRSMEEQRKRDELN